MGATRPLGHEGATASSLHLLELEIAGLEAEVRQIEEQLADHRTYDDPSALAALSRAHHDTSARLRGLYREWEQAAEEEAQA